MENEKKDYRQSYVEAFNKRVESSQLAEKILNEVNKGKSFGKFIEREKEETIVLDKEEILDIANIIYQKLVIENKPTMYAYSFKNSSHDRIHACDYCLYVPECRVEMFKKWLSKNDFIIEKFEFYDVDKARIHFCLYKDYQEKQKIR